ncbi:hypothetical protein OO015_11965 [Thermomicrobium sp. 4228-Ro]|uniref:hypothetical protein n=1 Tax=Thermomicrobium sp. 4228-Ro TaxID=2993937 RepID=UPI0022487849|nr:hypothetical protein [Thermomicrobium sp. 4228-Ro]MCX2728207.1 hypothetical protein [Thermomicrobium sp. 4228-Ro]
MRRRWWLWTAIGLVVAWYAYGHLVNGLAERAQGGARSTRGTSITSSGWSTSAGWEQSSGRVGWTEPAQESRPAWRITITNGRPSSCLGELGRDDWGRWVCRERLPWGESGTEICDGLFGSCRPADPWEASIATSGVDWCDTPWGPSSCEKDDLGPGSGPLFSSDETDDTRWPWQRQDEGEPRFGSSGPYPSADPWKRDTGDDGWFPRAQPPSREEQRSLFPVPGSAGDGGSSSGRDWP